MRHSPQLVALMRQQRGSDTNCQRHGRIPFESTMLSKDAPRAAGRSAVSLWQRNEAGQCSVKQTPACMHVHHGERWRHPGLDRPTTTNRLTPTGKKAGRHQLLSGTRGKRRNRKHDKRAEVGLFVLVHFSARVEERGKGGSQEARGETKGWRGEGRGGGCRATGFNMLNPVVEHVLQVGDHARR